MLKKIGVLVLLVVLLGGGLAAQQRTKSSGSYRGGDNDGAVLSNVAFSVGKITGPAVACSGTAVRFDLTVSGTGVYRYEWVKTTEPSKSFADSAFLKIPNCQPADNAKYYCKVTDRRTGAFAYSDTLDFEVKIQPQVQIIASAEKIAKGASVTLTASGATDYLWSTGATTARIVVTPGASMTYYVKGSNGICVDTKSKEIEVLKLEVETEGKVFLSSGMEATLTAKTMPGTTVTWFELPPGQLRARSVGSRTEVGTGPSLKVNPPVTTTYEAEVAFGEVKTSSYTTVYVKTKDTYRSGDQDGAEQSKITFSPGKISGPEEFCAGDKTSLDLRVTGVGVYSYTWRRINGGSEVTVGTDTSSYLIPAANSGHTGKYYCKVTDIRSGAVAYSDTVPFTVKSYPSLNIEAEMVKIAKGASVTLTASGADVYQWSTGETTAAVTVAPEETTTYQVTGTNGGLCRKELSQKIEVIRLDVSAGPNLYISSGMKVILTAQTNLDKITWYQLEPDGSSRSRAVGGTRTKVGEGPTLEVEPDETTTYEAEVEFGGYTSSSFVTVYVKTPNSYRGGDQDGAELSKIGFRVGNITGKSLICEEEDGVLTVNVSGTGVYSYQWTKITPSVTEVGIDSAALVIATATVSDSGSYFCEVTDIRSGDIHRSDTFRLQVKPYPKARISAPQNDTIICGGSTVSLDARATELGNLLQDTYQYAWSGQGAGSKDTAVMDVTPEVTTEYHLAVSNAGCVDMDTIRIVVYRPVIDLPASVYVAEGATVSLLAQTDDDAMNNPTTTIQWWVQGRMWMEGTATEAFDWPVMRKETVYAKMENHGCWAEDSCRLMMKLGGAYHSGDQDGYSQSCIRPRIFKQSPMNLDTCAIDSMTLYVLAEGSNLEFIWQKEVNYDFQNLAATQGIQGIGTYQLKFSPLQLKDAGLYRCIIRNSCGTVISDTFAVSVDGKPTLSSRLNKVWPQCEGSPVVEMAVIAFTPNGEPKYQWFRNNRPITGATGPGIKVDPLKKATSEGLYKVEVSNKCGIVADSMMLEVWEVARVKEYKTHLVTCDGSIAEFTMTVEGGGSYDIGLHEVTIIGGSLDAPVFTINPIRVGSGNRVRFPVDMSYNEKAYVWIVSNDCGKDTSTIVRLNVDKKPELDSYSTSPQVLCAGSPLRLFCTAKSGKPVSYKWYRNDVPYTTGSEINFTRITPQDAGYYRCAVSNEGCQEKVESPNIVVKVNDVPSLSKTLNSYGNDHCIGRKIELEANITGEHAYDSVRWYRNDRPLTNVLRWHSGTNTLKLSIDSIAADDDGTYYMKAFNGCGESRTDNFRLKVDHPAAFVMNLDGYADLVLCYGDEQSLSVQTTGTPDIMYMWTRNGEKIAEGYSSVIILKGVTVDSTGNYCCEIHNHCTDQATLSCAKIKVSSPDTFRLAGDGLFCQNAAAGAELKLLGSDTNDIYRLYRDGSVLVSTVAGNTIVPAGDTIVFPNLTKTGVYHVTATDTNHCPRKMPGEIKLETKPLPTEYALYISKQYCEGGSEATLTLGESQVGVIYQLYSYDADQVPIAYRPPVTGTGRALNWTAVRPGRYSVSAVNAMGCSAVMRNIVNVEKKPLPRIYKLLAMGNDSTYCSNKASDVALELQGFDAGNVYKLVRDGQDTIKPYCFTAPVRWSTNIEEGSYQVVVSSQAGCSAGSNLQRVVKREPPLIQTLSGGETYCRDYTGMQLLQLSGTQVGVMYRFYRKSDHSVVDMLRGTGNALTLQVPSVNEVYYVVATDTTPDACENRMNGEAKVQRTDLVVRGNPEQTRVGYGDPVQLDVAVSGGVAPVTYQWSPANALEQLTDDVLKNPWTKPLERGVVMRVEVRDESGCVEYANVVINIDGGPLVAEIQDDPQQKNAIDTVKICADETFSLYGWRDGGVSGPNIDRWIEQGDTIARTMALQQYKKRGTGYLYFQARRGNLVALDSVWVQLRDSAVAYDLVEMGMSCVDPVDKPIRLSNSEAGVFYELEYSRGCDGNFIATSSNMNSPVGGMISLLVQNVPNFYGCYRIRADKGIGDEVCSTYMNGVTELRPKPQLLNLRGDNTYCAGSVAEDTLVLYRNSEQGVNYLLERVSLTDTILLAKKPGTGDSIVFAGRYGTGRYEVRGVTAYCNVRMNNHVEIRENPLPQDTVRLEGRGVYCSAKTPLVLSIPAPEAGIRYSLYRDSAGMVTFIDVLNNQPLTVTGTGRYYVEAENRNTRCSRRLSDTVQINRSPGVFTLAGADAKYCTTESGALMSLKVFDKAEADVTYTLVNEKDETKPAWAFGSFYADTVYYSGLLSRGDYKVKATLGNCSRLSEEEILVKPVDEPADIQLQQAMKCASDSVTLWSLYTSEPGVDYSLYRDDAGSVTWVMTLPGDNLQLNFGKQWEIGEYYVMARSSEMEACEKRLTGTVMIRKSPQMVKLVGGASYCVGTAGATTEVKLYPAEAGVTYTLALLSGADIGVMGDRNVDSVYYRGVLQAGTYIAKATLGSCERQTTDEVTIIRNEIPRDVAVSGAGDYCPAADMSVLITINNPETDVEYSLYRDRYSGGVTLEKTLSGPGPLAFGQYIDKGIYYIMARRSNGCELRLTGEVRIGDTPELPHLSGTDRKYCDGAAGVRVDLKVWPVSEGASYNLYPVGGSVAVGTFANPVVDSLYFTGVLPAGAYIAKADLGTCGQVGKDTVHVTKVAAPQEILLTSVGEQCVFQPVEIGITSGEPGVSYLLSRDSAGVVTNLTTITGSGPLTWGVYSGIGKYKVKADNGVCARDMSSTVTLKRAPAAFAVTGSGTVCEGIAGTTVQVDAAPSEEEVIYRLYSAVGGSVVANLSRVGNVSSYNGILAVGRYVVKADFEGCILASTDTVQVTALRVDDRALLAPLTLCSGEGSLNMGVKKSQVGVVYELWQKGTPDNRLTSASGTGNDLSVGNATAPGIYYIRGHHTACNTDRALPGVYEIGEKPQVYAIVGDTEFCAASKGVSIGVSGTESGVVYRLQRHDGVAFADVTPPATITAATGGAEWFSALFGAGKYRVVAKKGCEIEMQGELDVVSKAMPADTVKVEVAGNPCVDSTLLITVHTEIGTDYTLLFNGQPTANPALGGDGSPQQFTINKALTGKYELLAERDGCEVILPHPLEIGTPPFIDVLYADTAVCADQKALLYMNQYNAGVTYKLYSADTVVKARIAVRTNYEFLDILPGTYHVQASNEMCTANSNEVTVRPLVVPELPATVWAWSDCVSNGKGWIDLKQLSDTVVYRISSPALGGVDSVIADYNGNKRLAGLPTGTYTMTVTHKVNGCRSSSLTGIIRQGISEEDTLTADRSYCASDPAGMKLRLNTCERNIQYTILSKDGSHTYTAMNNQTEFPNRVTIGEYQFRRERTGLNGGCFTVDTIEVVEDTLPSRKVKVEVIGGPVLCAGTNYQVKVKASLPGIIYQLRDPNGVLVEAIKGTGSDLPFSRVIQAVGSYQLYLSNGKCEQLADTVITIHPLPATVTMTGCAYCYDRNQGIDSKGCAVTLGNMRNGVRYILEDVNLLPLDTILRPLATFAEQPAGTYTVRAEDTLTGCRAEMGTAQITGKKQPAAYTVGNGCNTSSVVATIDGSEVGVYYYLLRNGSVVGNYVVGTGSNISFGVQATPGVYKILARIGSDCPVLMKDSVLIYNQLKDCELLAVNELCEGEGNGVTLSYRCSVPGWSYYVTDGTLNSDTLKGTQELKWSAIGGRLITAGSYYIVAFNSCRWTAGLDTVEVQAGVKPLQQIIRGNGKYCNSTGFDVSLGGSESDVTYRLELRSPKMKFPEVTGTGQALKLNTNPLVRSGWYDVYARKTGSQCEYLLVSKQMEPGTQPDFQNVIGEDICVTTGGSESLTLCLAQKETQRVDYFLLEKGSGQQKAVLGSGANDLCFPPQSAYGVYKVVARHRESLCERTMTGEYAIGPKPTVFAVVSTHDTVRLCAGLDTCIRITGSEPGVNYQLYRDGTKIGSPVAGDRQGSAIKVGCVQESGVYKVLAYNKCEEWMTDSVIVKKMALPPLFIHPEPYRYCELKPGVTIIVNKTRPDDTYELFWPAGGVAETLPGNSDGSEINFAGEYFEGHYPLKVTSTVTNCSLTDTVIVDMDSLPKPFSLQAIPNAYICAGSEGVNVVLSGSEVGLVYGLYEVNSSSAVKEVIGEGTALDFGKVKEAGSYLVTTVYPWSGCKGESIDLLTLIQADTVKRFEVTALRASYCYTEGVGGSVKLSGSTVGVVYDLYCENVLMDGQSVDGTGAELVWRGLKGKACGTSKGDADGLLYTVRGRSTVSNCEEKMAGGARILEEEEPVINYFHPNEALSICQDSFMNFAVIAKGCNLQYNWYQRDILNVTRLVQDATTVNEALYKIDAAADSDFGTYWCEVSNSCQVTVSTVKVAVGIRKTVIQDRPMEDVEICGDKSKLIALDAQIQNAQRYEWRKKGDDRLLATGELLWVSDTNDAEYICKAMSPCNTIYDTCAVRHVVNPKVKLVKGGSDTICAGTPYELEVEANYNVEWFLNGNKLSHVGNRLYLPAVTATDEGRYSVRVKNACNEENLIVADLYVDQPIVLDQILPNNNPVTCVGSPITLVVKTTPFKRVAYEWKYGLETRGYGPALRIPALADTNTQRTYTVYFRNKCREYNADGTARDFATVRIKLNPGIDFTDPEREVIVCADPVKDTVLRILHPKTQIAKYEWFYFNHLKDTVSMSSVADTIKIPLRTENNGYYYCRIENACGTVASNSCWFRVDSVPVILTNFADDTLCEGSKLKIGVEATGGSLYYNLVMKRKNGQIDTIAKDFETLYESVGELAYGPLTYADHDSSQVWCNLRNGCGEAISDTMLLRIHPWRKLSVTPDSIKVCGNDTGRVELKLLNGTFPWKYKYQTPSGQEVSVSDVSDSVSRMKVWETGTYRVSYVEDATGCARYNGLPVVVATSRGLSEAKISGGKDGCVGDTASVQISIKGGRGPWELWIEDERGGVGMNLVVSGRDTSLVVSIMDSVRYFVDMIKDLSTGCIGIATDDRSTINAQVPDIIDFAMDGDSHIGQCQQISLLEKFKPTLRTSGTAVTGNNFWLNGRKQNSVFLTVNTLKGLSGEQTIECKYTDVHGCLVSSPEVSLFVDTLPSAEIIMDKHACGNVQMEYKVNLLGTPKFTVELERRLFKYARYSVTEDYRKWQPVLGVRDTVYRGLQAWNESDSCLIVRVTSLSDRHGCPADYALLPTDTVYHHLNPDMEAWTRYPNAGDLWSKGATHIYISRGDSVGVKGVLTVGDTPWNLHCSPYGSIYGIHGRDTIFALDTGDYRLTASHEYCDISASYGEELKIRYRDTGYVKIKVLLDGPLDITSGEMQTAIEDKLPLYGITQLPDRSKVRNKQIIDWVEVELRTGLEDRRDSIAQLGQGALLVTRDSCLLWADGTVTDRLGDTVIALPGASAQGVNQYYVVVRHRNHLPVMSARRYNISRTRTGTISKVDLTQQANVYCSTRYRDLHLHMSEVASGGKTYWAMSAGDMNSNALVSVFDPNKMNLRISKPTPDGQPGGIIQVPDTGYDLFDINFDGEVDWPGWGKQTNTLDWDKVRKNRSKFTEIKF